MFQKRFFYGGKRLAAAGLLILCMAFAGLPAQSEDGFKPIFNGKDLTGWDGDTNFWSVKDGAITGQSTPENPCKKNTFLIWRAGELDDFELRLKIRIVDGNSGIQYRSRELGQWAVGGYQADFEAGPRWTGALYDEHGRGPLATRGQKTVIGKNGEKKSDQVNDTDELFKLIKKEEWNDYTISARGTHLIHTINGKVMSEVIDNETAKGARSGILALQVHSGPPMTVQFKDIRLKRFKIADKKKIVLVAGPRSHAHGDHEHNAGIVLLKHCLDQLPETVSATYHNGFPKDPTAFDNADSILVFSDGGGRHPIFRRKGMQLITEQMKKGVGLAIVHYAVEVPKNQAGQQFLDWIGGYYESGFSTNPHWDANFKTIPVHPVTRGVKPFELRDEWYFNIHFRPNMKGVTSLLSATPPDNVRKSGPSKQFPGRSEIVAWCVERPDGGRGFGFTGGHFHKNWGNDNYRTFILNAIYWTAQLDIPAEGVPSTMTEEFLLKNWDRDRQYY